jgi:PAS domain-containing protein
LSISDHDNDYLRAVLDAVPLPIFVVNQELCIVDTNEAAGPLLERVPRCSKRTRAGEVLYCFYARISPEGCGKTSFCRNCTVRNSVLRSFEGGEVIRRRTKVVFENDSPASQKHYLVTTAPFDYRNERFVLLTLEDVSELLALKRAFPICSGCKKIRDDQDYWHNVESYLKEHFDLDFSHGLCPECATNLYPDLKKSTEG